jgi:hypothetical protein
MASDALSIEEYLAGEQYQLGEPRGVYRRSVTFSGQVAFFALMLFVLDLVMVVALMAIEGLAGLSAATPLGVVQPMIALANLFSSVRHEAVVMPFSRKVSVSVYHEGLLYRRGSRIRVVRWEDIIAVRRAWRVERRKGKLKRVTYASICSIQAQPNLALDAGIDRVAELGKLIEQEVLRRQLPPSQEKIQAGETVVFEKFSLSAQSIQYGTQSRNWSRLREIEIGPDRLVLQDTDNAAEAFTIPLTSLPNICIVEDLLTWLSAEQEPAFLVTWEEPIPRKARRSFPSDAVKKTSHPGKVTWATRLALMCIVVGGLALQVLAVSDIFQNEALEQIPTQTYRVSSSSMLVLSADDIDHLFLLNNEQDQPTVSVNGWKETRGITSLADIQLQSRQRGDTLFLTWAMKQPMYSFLGSEKVELFIDVPSSTNVHLVTRTGDLTIGYLRGEIQVTTQSTHVDMQAEVQGHSFVQTTSGQIDFRGTFTPDSHDTFQSTSGNINLTLHAPTIFSVRGMTSETQSTEQETSSVQGKKEPVPMGVPPWELALSWVCYPYEGWMCVMCRRTSAFEPRGASRGGASRRQSSGSTLGATSRRSSTLPLSLFSAPCAGKG